MADLASIRQQMLDMYSQFHNAIAPTLGQQPIAVDRYSHTPIYQGAPSSTELGATYSNLLSPGSRIVMNQGQDQTAELQSAAMKHEIIHALVNQHKVDPAKLNFQPDYNNPNSVNDVNQFKSNLAPEEQISYALAGPGNSPELKQAMTNAVTNSTEVPEIMKTKLRQLGVMSK